MMGEDDPVGGEGAGGPRTTTDDPLEALGWDAGFDAAFRALALSGVEPARVVRIDRESSRVAGRSGEHAAMLPKKLRRDAESRPAVGDWVAVEPLPGDERVIRAIVPRRSRFARKVAGKAAEEQVVSANVDTVFLVTGLDLDFNVRRIERYVTLAWDSGAQPVVVLNKADLADDVAARLDEVRAVAPDVPVIAISAKHDEGLEQLRDHMGPGRTVALLGSSGAGKSTLLNRLLGTAHMRTREVREHDSRGRHTTTHRELVRLPDGTLLIDNPGMRELQVWGSDEAVDDTFADIDALAAACRFTDCTHATEPGCAVRPALESGELAAPRFAAYEKLRAEYTELDRRRTERERTSGYRSLQRARRRDKGDG